MTDKKLEKFLEELRRDFGITLYSDFIFFIERAFKAGRKAQREDMVDEEIADKQGEML